MSTKNWKDNELNTLLMEKWGYKSQVIEEKKGIKNPGKYIDGERAKIGLDDDGDGVPDKADKDPNDGSVQEQELDEKKHKTCPKCKKADKDCVCPDKKKTDESLSYDNSELIRMVENQLEDLRYLVANPPSREELAQVLFSKTKDLGVNPQVSGLKAAKRVSDAEADKYGRMGSVVAGDFGEDVGRAFGRIPGKGELEAYAGTVAGDQVDFLKPEFQSPMVSPYAIDQLKQLRAMEEFPEISQVSVRENKFPSGGDSDSVVVKKGDTLSAIAKDRGVTVDDIINHSRNKIASPDKIKVGQEIFIPQPGVGRKAATMKEQEMDMPDMPDIEIPEMPDMPDMDIEDLEVKAPAAMAESHKDLRKVIREAILKKLSK